MGSIQSRNKNPLQLVNKDVTITVTKADQFDEDEEFFECDSFMIQNEPNTVNDENSFEKQSSKSNKSDDVHKISDKETSTDSDDSDDSWTERKMRQQRELDDFREEINKKRTLRQQCLKKLRDELTELNDKLAHQMMINEQLHEAINCGSKSTADDRDTNNEINTENKNLKIELAECQMLLQKLNGENLNACIENQALREHIRSLKEVNKAMKEMLAIRETQVDQLKLKLEEIECSFSDRETKILSTDLKQEYQRQLENIRNMRSLYEERSNLLLQENNVLKQQFEDKEHELQIEIEKSKSLEEFIGTLEKNLDVKNNDIKELEGQIAQLRSDKMQTDDEMNAVNHLISQILFDFNSSGSNVDFDMLLNMLEENREFLKEIAIKEDYGGIDTSSFLPKVLYELFLQVHQNSNSNSIEDNQKENLVNTPEEIAIKLPKVWKILIELLGHQNKVKDSIGNVDDTDKSVLDDCYKSIQTANGSQAVLSVSKTFIKLRDLIFEKRSLQKDTTRLKTLYSHLEQRLDNQEKKLSSVSLELTKTWHLVGKIKRQHRQLHTHEQILCYQLQQKRRVLNELKAELEYCRKKWALARAINTESEKQCQEMRNEFLLRKIQDQNSAESGYSDEHQSDGDECEQKNSMIGNEFRKNRFDRNLSEFYRIPLSAIDSADRRRSLELPIIYKIISNEGLTSRAQSEPPCFRELEKVDSLPDEDFDGKSQASCIPVEFGTMEIFSSDSVLITLPPNIQECDKANKHACKIRKKLEKNNKKNKWIKGLETAEQMFYRLTKSINGEVSITSTSEDEELENIEEIPLDVSENTVSEVKIDSEPISCIKEQVKQNDFEELQNKDLPSCSTSNDDFLTMREARLARLEAETKEFYEKMTRDKEKRNELDIRLETVHKNFLDRQKDKSEIASNEASTSSENNNAEAIESDKDDEDDERDNK